MDTRTATIGSIRKAVAIGAIGAGEAVRAGELYTFSLLSRFLRVQGRQAGGSRGNRTL